MTDTTTTQGPVYKVISADGQSCHGGTATWQLPNGDEPGAWMPPIAGRLVMCERGYHLTREPARWWMEGAQVYEAEARGAIVDDGGEKLATREARLLRPVAWAEVGVYAEGRHVVQRGYARASGSAHVEAWESAHVEAWGSAHVVAWGSAHVEAWESAHVEAWGSAHVVAWESAHVVARESAHVEAWESAHVVAWGSAHVEAWGSAHVVARESAHVEAWGSAHVEAWGSAHVEAWGSAHVEADDESTVVSTRWHSPSAEVALRRMAAHVDRRDGAPIVHTAKTVAP
jgi:hypothetical protein